MSRALCLDSGLVSVRTHLIDVVSVLDGVDVDAVVVVAADKFGGGELCSSPSDK
jgi:hypothetical protein